MFYALVVKPHGAVVKQGGGIWAVGREGKMDGVVDHVDVAEDVGYGRSLANAWLGCIANNDCLELFQAGNMPTLWWGADGYRLRERFKQTGQQSLVSVTVLSGNIVP